MTRRDRLELLLLAMIWGASFLFMRIASPEFGAVALVQIRVAVAALLLVVVVFLRGGARQLLEHALALTIVGATSSALPFTLFAYATLSVTAGTAALVNATAPLFAAVVAYAWLREKLPPIRIAGLIVGFGGVLVLVWDKLAIQDAASGLALSAALAASFSYGIAVNYTKARLHAVDPIIAAAGSQLSSTLLLLPFAAVYRPAVSPSLESWLAVLALGLLCTGVAYLVYFRLIARIGPTRAITVTYLVPLFGMLWGLVFLHEAITTGMVVACAIILAGTALATGRHSPDRPSRPRRTHADATRSTR